MAKFWSLVWEKLRAILVWCCHHLLAPVVAILLFAGAILAVVLGAKKIPVGGLIGRLFGEDPKQAIDVANSIDPQRIDGQGNLIPIGTPDAKGDTQVQVVPIDPPGIFSDPKTVTFTPPGTDKPQTVDLPVGVTSKDVEHVVVVSPIVTVVTVKDNSGISAQQIDDLLKKYGG